MSDQVLEMFDGDELIGLYIPVYRDSPNHPMAAMGINPGEESDRLIPIFSTVDDLVDFADRTGSPPYFIMKIGPDDTRALIVLVAEFGGMLAFDLHVGGSGMIETDRRTFFPKPDRN
jgi:hypothetical protein